MLLPCKEQGAVSRGRFTEVLSFYFLSILDVILTPCRHVVLLMDEMKVREDLVFDRNGEVIGYVDIEDINNWLRKLEKSCKMHG